MNKKGVLIKLKQFWDVENFILFSCLMIFLVVLVSTVLDIFVAPITRTLCIAGSVLITIILGHSVLSLKKRNRMAEDEWFALRKEHFDNIMREGYRKESEALLGECERIRKSLEDTYEKISSCLEQEQYDKIQSFLEDKAPIIEEGELFLSGNRVIDVILSQKIFRARQEGIHLRCDIQYIRLSAIREADLNILLSNLLDNAIEAVIRWKNESDGINDSSKMCEHVIGIKISMHKNYLLISENNPCVNVVTGRHNGLATSKNDTDMHGIGMQSMLRIIDRYGGMMEYEIIDGRFSLRIVMEDKSHN